MIRSSTKFLDAPSCNPQHTTVPFPNTQASPDTLLDDDGSFPATVIGVHKASSKRTAEAGRALSMLVKSYFSAVANVYTGRMAPRVGVGLARIGKEAEAVRFRDDGDLFGFGFGVGMLLGGWAVATARAKNRTAIEVAKGGGCRTERKTQGSRELICAFGGQPMSRDAMAACHVYCRLNIALNHVEAIESVELRDEENTPSEIATSKR